MSLLCSVYAKDWFKLMASLSRVRGGSEVISAQLFANSMHVIATKLVSIPKDGLFIHNVDYARIKIVAVQYF